MILVHTGKRPEDQEDEHQRSQGKYLNQITRVGNKSRNSQKGKLLGFHHQRDALVGGFSHVGGE